MDTASNRPTAVEYNGITGETIERELTDEEIELLPIASTEPLGQ